MQIIQRKSYEKSAMMKLMIYYSAAFLVPFVLAQPCVLTYMYPLCAAFLIACTSFKRINTVAAVAGAAVGAAFIPVMAGKYIFICAFMGALLIIKEFAVKSESTAMDILIAAVAFLAAFLFFGEKTIFSLIVSIAEIGLTGIFAAVFKKALKAMLIKKRSAVLNEEETICVLIFLTLLILSLSRVVIFNVSLMHIVFMLSALVLTYLGGNRAWMLFLPDVCFSGIWDNGRRGSELDLRRSGSACCGIYERKKQIYFFKRFLCLLPNFFADFRI